jgi:hypothetical protein
MVDDNLKKIETDAPPKAISKPDDADGKAWRWYVKKWTRNLIQK